MTLNHHVCCVAAFSFLILTFPSGRAAAPVCDSPQLAATRIQPVGGVGFAMVAGDFNHDGKADLAVAVGTASDNLQVFLGNGDGTLQTPARYTVVDYPTVLATADLNHDGQLDLITGPLQGPLYFVAGNPDGSFKPGISITNTGGTVFGTGTFAFGQFASDTNLALVRADSIFLKIQRGNGDGTFQAEGAANVQSSGALAEGVGGVAIGDMNGDGRNDIVVTTTALNSGHIGVLLGAADGSFAPSLNNPVTSTNSLLALGDFNKDGRLDVAAVDPHGAVTILLGQGDGIVRSNVSYKLPAQIYTLSVADFNSDGTNDLAFASLSAVTILLSNGDGTFRSGSSYDTLGVSLAFADFNGDGALDVGAALPGSSHIGLTLGRGDGTFLAAPHYGVGRNPQFVSLSDLNKDGFLDMVVANLEGNNLSVLLNKGDGTYLPAVNYKTAPSPQAVAIADLNGDGTNDLVTTTSVGTNQLSVLLGKGDGTFGLPLNYGSFGGGPIGVGDFNNDGKLDVLANNLVSGMQVQLGNGKGSFTPSAAASGLNAFGFSPAALAVGDFNGDKKLDFVFANNFGTNVSVCLGKGDGTFQAAVSYPSGTNSFCVAAADLNGDGKLDLAVANNGTAAGADGSVAVLLGKGDGTFQAADHYFAGSHPVFVTAGDLNGDGKVDLAVRNLADFGVEILLGNGDGTFRPFSYFGSMSAAGYGVLALGDLNNDGKLDAAVLNNAANVAVLLNTCAETASSSPTISATLAGGSIVLTWPLAATGFVAEFTSALGSAWQTVTNSPVTLNDAFQLTVPAADGSRFFRLRR